MNNQTDKQAFDDWHCQDFCETFINFEGFTDNYKKELYKALLTLPHNQILKENQFKAWQAAMQIAAVKQAEVVKQTELIGIDLNGCTAIVELLGGDND